MFKKILSFLLLLLFPCLLCLNVWQSFRYQQLQDEIAELQNEQLVLIEKNRKALAAVAVYSSPSRVGALAEDNPDLQKAKSGQVILLEKESP